MIELRKGLSLVLLMKDNVYVCLCMCVSLQAMALQSVVLLGAGEGEEVKVEAREVDDGGPKNIIDGLSRWWERLDASEEGNYGGDCIW